jgi:hypothetical protein
LPWRGERRFETSQCRSFVVLMLLLAYLLVNYRMF